MPTLKERNLRWLVMIVALDVAILVFASLGPVPSLSAVAIRGVFIPLLPVAVLLLSNVMPHQIKDSLVFWKGKHALPGHAAFTKHGPADSRINMAALRKNVGALPSDPAEQNSFWYTLYKQADSDAAVSEAQRMYVLFRDAAALSFMCLILVPLALFVSRAGRDACLTALGLFAVQYAIAALSARFNGIRLVGNVLAHHAAKR